MKLYIMAKDGKNYPKYGVGLTADNLKDVIKVTKHEDKTYLNLVRLGFHITPIEVPIDVKNTPIRVPDTDPDVLMMKSLDLLFQRQALALDVLGTHQDPSDKYYKIVEINDQLKDILALE